MVLVTKSHPQSTSHSSQASSSTSTSTSTSSNPKRRSLFGGLARRRQSSDNYDSDSNPDSKSRNNNTSSSSTSVSSPPPLPTSPPPSKTQFNTNQYSQPTTKSTSQWPGGPQSLDDWVNRSADTRDADQASSSSQGRNIMVGQNGNGNPSSQHHSHSVGHAGNATSTSNDFQLNSNQDGSPPIFGTEEWDSMQYVLDRVEDGSMINSSDSPPNPQDHSKFNQNQSSSSNDSSQEQSFPLGRVSLDLLVHDPSETRPFAGVQPRPRQDSAPQLVHSRHRSHFSIPDVVVTAAEEEGQGQHFEVKVPAAKRRSFVLNVHNPQIHSMPTNDNNNNGGATTGFPSKKNKGANKLKPLIRLDSPVVSTGSPNAFVINSSNSVGEEMNSNGTGSNNSSANSTLSKGSGTTTTSSSSSIGTSSSNTTVPSNRKGKKTFSLFGKKSSPSTSPNPAQPTSPTTSNPIGKPFYSSPHDSSGSLPTSSSASGAESSKESLAMKSSSKEANQANTSPPTSTSSDGESIGGGGGGGFSGLPRSVPNFNIPSNGVPAPTSNLIKGNASPSIGSFQTPSPQPSSINSFSPQSSAPNSPNPNGTWNNAVSSFPKKLTKKEQKMREKQELDLIKQVEKIDKMVRQHDEKERKREKKEREKMKKNANNTLDSLQQNDDVVENVVKVPKPQSKMRRLTIFSAKSKAGPAAANQQAQMAALERKNSARRVNPRPPSSKGIATNSVVNENRQPQLHQQGGREPDSSNFSFPPRPPPPSSQQQQQQANSGSPPSTLNRSRPPRTRPPQLPQEEGFSSSQSQGQSQRNGPAPPTIVLTSPSSPVRTSFSESYPQPSNLPCHEEDMASKPIPVLAGIGETVKRASQEWQDLTSPTRTEFPSMSDGSENGSPNQSISSSTGLSRSTSLQRALAYTHAEEGMIRKKANLKRRGSKRSISGGGSGSTRSSIVDSDGTSTPQRRPSFLRKGSGNVKQVEDGEWEEEEEEEEERSISSKNQNQGASPGSITPKAGNVTPQGRISPSSTSPNQINHVTTTNSNNPPPILPAVSFSRPFSRPPPPPIQSSPSPSSPTKIKAEPFTDAMAHIISAASPPLEAAKVRTNPIYYDNEKNRNGSVSSNSTGGSSGSSRTGDGSPKKYRNLPGGGRKDDHFVFPIVRTVRSSTLDNPTNKPNDGQNSKDYGTSPLPRSSSTPQYF